MERGKELGMNVKVIRPGPLVDLESFEPPGRLGREIGRWFVAVGNRRGKLSLCQVQTAAEIIRYYAEHFDDAPPILNAVEPNPLTRGELVERLHRKKPDLKVRWVPMIFVRVANPFLKLLQRALLRGRTPIDISAAFANVHYDTTLIKQVLKNARA